MQNTTDGKYYIWHGDNWHELKMESSGIEMGLYDMNKQIIAQLPDLTDFTTAEQAINALHVEHHNAYYMLYGKEISYFTIFKIKEPQYLGQEVIDCLKYVGQIKSVDLYENKAAVEIWVYLEGEGSIVLYLFPYDMGIVQVGE